MYKNSRTIRAVISLLIAIIVAVPGALLPRAEAVSGDDTELLIDEIIGNEVSLAGAGSPQSLLDGKYADGAGTLSDWFVFSLIQYRGNSLNYDKYASQLKKYCEKKNSHDTSVTKERFAMMFMLLGTESNYIREVCQNSIGKLGIMSWIYGLHLLSNGCTAPVTEDEIIEEILSQQLPDGGWDLQQKSADPDVTSMAVQALSHRYSSRQDVKSAVDKALNLLSDRQLANGGFKSFGVENPESCAQVITALTSLGINPLSDKRFIKNGKSPIDAMLTYKTASGGYSHTAGGEYNITSTSQVLYSLVSIYRLQNGSGSLYNLNSGIKANTGAEKPASAQKETTAYTQAIRSGGNPQIVRPAVTTTAAASGTQSAQKTESKTQINQQTVTFTASASSRSRRSTGTKKESTVASDELTALKSKTEREKTTASPARHDSKSKTTLPAKTSPITSVTASLGTEKTETYNENDNSISEKINNENNSEIKENGPESENGETFSASHTDNNNNKEKEGTSARSSSPRLTRPKKYIIAAIWSAALIIALIFILKKNKKAVNYIIVFSAAAALTLGTVLADIQSSEDYYKKEDVSSPETVTVTMSITCDTVKGKGNEKITPSDGIILPETEFTLPSGSTAYDCLIKAAKEYKIQIEDNTQALGNHSNAYIAGINYLYEFDYGELSGWMFSVNGEFADRGCGEYKLSDSDIIRWEYTCNMGDDLK